MSARKSGNVRGWGVAAALLLTVCSASAPRPAAAQLGSLIVNMTAPPNGSTVSGTTTVSASVTIVGLLTVQSVQFKLDGANLGAADTSAPYSVAWNTTTAANGSHTLTAVARDILGLQFTSQPVTVTVSNAPPPDTTQPSVSVTSPSAGATVSGTITLAASASDNVGVAGVQFFVDGAARGAEDTTSPYSVSWDTTAAANGSHSITARARDAAGNTRTSSAVSVTVSNAPPPDTTQPSVSVTSPASGATVSGTVSVTASASDNVGVTGVQFMLDGVNLGGEDTSSPYSVSWNTTTATNGAHSITARARDAAGNTRTSSAVSVTVSNADTTQPTVSVTSPASGATVSGTITLAASASDNVGVAGVQFFVDGAARGAEDTTSPYSVTWDTTTAANGTHSITARARDAAGNTRTSSAVSVTVSNTTPDTTQPTVSVTSPASGATVSGTITVTASASDNVGVVGVQFLRDGVNLGAEDTTAPYSVPWDTTTVANGSHTLTARARDAAGNSRTSTAVSVTVSNGAPPDTTRPTVTLTSPAAGATVSGTINVTASASDNVGVAGVQFLRDGVNLGAEDTTAPYAVAWDTTTASNGAHTLSARARDAAGNTADTTPITVTVSNTSSGTVTRVQQTAAAVTYAGSWTHGDQTFAWSGGTASFSRGGAGTSATLTFTGTQVSWIGWREARGGMARVLLDGVVVATVDLYSATAEISVPVFTSATLPEGSHTLVIEATGAKNAAAADSIVVVDAFDVTSTSAPPPPPPPSGRVQETDPNIVYAGAWFEETTFPWTDGRAMFAVNEGTATFTFTGTGVSWIGYLGHFGGIVRVFMDGAQVAEIDTYRPVDEVGVPVYTATGLAAGTHAIRIELTPMKNPAADASETAVDAFDVTP